GVDRSSSTTGPSGRSSRTGTGWSSRRRPGRVTDGCCHWVRSKEAWPPATGRSDMFEEGQYFAPIVKKDDGSVAVQLGEGHPGLEDAVYRERRDRIATAAAQWRPGDAAPVIDYTDEEHEVWRVVCADLHDKHRRYACREYLDGKERFSLPEDHVP